MDRTVIVATLILVAGGLYTVLTGKNAVKGQRRTTLTRVFIGGYMLALIVSTIDLVGPPVQGLSSALLLTAVLTTVLAIGSDILARYQARGGATQGAGAHQSVH